MKQFSFFIVGISLGIFAATLLIDALLISNEIIYSIGIFILFVGIVLFKFYKTQ